MRPSKGHRVVLAAGAVALVVLALALWPAASPVPPPLPVPNGYDDLLRAAALAPQDRFNEFKAVVEELRARLALGRDALVLARAGMSKECRGCPSFPGAWLPAITEAPAQP